MSKFSLGHYRAAKLTPSDVLEIRRLYSEENWSQGRLAREFKMSVGQIGRIVRGESWHQYHQIPTDQEIEHDAAVAQMKPPASEEEIRASMERLGRKLGITIKPADPIEPTTDDDSQPEETRTDDKHD